MSETRRISFVAWTSRPGRATEIAAALDGDAYCVYPALLGKRVLVPLRYLVSAWLTIRYLRRRRPEAVIVTNPPIAAALTVAAYARVMRTPFVLDSHPTAFGAKDHAVSKVLLPVHRRLARRALLTLVSSPHWAAFVTETWQAKAQVMHEAPPRELDASPTPSNEAGDSTVLFVGIFGGDEPVDIVVEAARLLPDTQFKITGDVARAAPGLVAGAPPNVTFTGYLRGAEYASELLSSSVVLALTTEPTSAMRAAFEAVWAQRPLVISDTPLLRELFPHATFVANEGGALAAGLTKALEHSGSFTAAAQEALARQHRHWAEQRDKLRRRLSAVPADKTA